MHHDSEATTLSDIESNILTSLYVLFPAQDFCAELRIPTRGKSGTYVGFYDSRELLARDAAKFDGKHPAVYVTLNRPDSALLARYPKNTIDLHRSATAANDVVCYSHLLIDCDPKRPALVSSTDAEKTASFAKQVEVCDYLKQKGWSQPIIADSGNGAHAIFNVALPNTPEVAEAVHAALKHLSEKFSDDKVKVDIGVFDPPRVVKLHGTIACKGENTQDRPHRRSAIIFAPDSITPISLEQLKALVLAPKSKTVASIHSIPNYSGKKLPPVSAERMEEFFEFYGLDSSDSTPRQEGGLKWIVQECPFNLVHDYAVFLHDGNPGFKCFHDSAGCCDKQFSEYHKLLQERTGKKFNFHPEIVTKTKLNIRFASEIKPELITWLWKNRIALGKLTLFIGMPGLGKGLATMDITARVSTGANFPDSPNSLPSSHCLIFSSEDAASDTLVPRLMAAKADRTKVAIVETVTTVDGVKQFSLDTDLPALQDTLEADPELRLVIIDPLLNHLGEKSANKEQDIRAVLTPLGKLAEKIQSRDHHRISP